MLRRIFMVVMAMLLVVFGVNRVNHSKSVVTSNYLVLKSVENQNLTEVVNSVRFYIPSFQQSMLHMNSSPYTNADGEVEVYIGEAVEGDFIKDGLDSINNNYLFSSTIEYVNETKKVKVTDNVELGGNIGSVEYLINTKNISGEDVVETVSLMTMLGID